MRKKTVSIILAMVMMFGLNIFTSYAENIIPNYDDDAKVSGTYIDVADQNNGMNLTTTSVSPIRGDLDGSGEVDGRDAIYLLYHTFFPESYTLNQSGDFDNSGKTDSKDAIHLLYHTFYPESYPLNPDTPQKITYTVTFKDWDGTILKTQIVDEGENATAPSNPTREGYVFISWDKAFSNVKNDMVVTAIYQRITTNPTFIVNTVNAMAGDTGVEVTVAVKNNPGICSIFISLDYDRTALTLTGWEYNSAILGGQTTPFNNAVTSPKLTWTNFCISEVTGDWVYATLYFNVSETAKGNNVISITYDEDDVYNVDETNIAFDIINGGININN